MRFYTLDRRGKEGNQFKSGDQKSSVYRFSKERLRFATGILIAFCLVILLSCCEEDSEMWWGPATKGPRHDCDYPDWSPKNDYIAYDYLLYDPDNVDSIGLYLFDLSDSTYSKILGMENRHTPQNPDFSPDGKWLVFRWNVQIWKSTITGDSLQQLTFGGTNWYPDWSPDGRKIAYFHYTTGEDTSGVYIMNRDGTGKEFIVMGRCPVWIDSNSFVYSRSIINHDMAIYSYDISSKQKEKIIDYKKDWIWAAGLALSRTTSQLAFVTNEKEDVIAHLWVVNLDGTGLVEVTPEGLGGDSPAWSPDGSTIVYVNGQNGQIYLMDADGSNERPLINSGGESYESGKNILGVGLNRYNGGFSAGR